jgi:hypothetical protein
MIRTLVVYVMTICHPLAQETTRPHSTVFEKISRGKYGEHVCLEE